MSGRRVRTGAGVAVGPVVGARAGVVAGVGDGLGGCVRGGSGTGVVVSTLRRGGVGVAGPAVGTSTERRTGAVRAGAGVGVMTYIGLSGGVVKLIVCGSTIVCCTPLANVMRAAMRANG